MSRMQEEYQVPGCQIGTHCDLSRYQYTVCMYIYVYIYQCCQY